MKQIVAVAIYILLMGCTTMEEMSGPSVDADESPVKIHNMYVTNEGTPSTFGDEYFLWDLIGLWYSPNGHQFVVEYFDVLFYHLAKDEANSHMSGNLHLWDDRATYRYTCTGGILYITYGGKVVKLTRELLIERGAPNGP